MKRYFLLSSLALAANCLVAQSTLISAIQSNTDVTPLKGVKVTVTGVVTKDLQKAIEQKGFYIQDLNADASDLTSEGIFIFDSLGGVDVTV